MDSLPLPLVNAYLAHKQHLLAPGAAGVAQVTRDLVALHATDPTAPYLSLCARLPGFERQALDGALYTRRELVRNTCMRATLHAVPGDELPFFLQAFAGQHAAEVRALQAILVQAGICHEDEAPACLQGLQRRVLGAIAARETSTVRDLGQAVPELAARVRHSAGRAYEGEFSVGSRLIPVLCAQGLLVRTRPQGTWRSNLYEYALLSRWLPQIDPSSVAPPEAQAWLVRRYLAAFGPATPDDIQWWTGFARGEMEGALRSLQPALARVALAGLGDGFLMLAEDLRQLRHFALPAAPYVSLLPGLDPYIMGYRDRRRFLAPEHQAKVFDRAGNAMPTVWTGGRVVGVWRERTDGSIAYGLFAPVKPAEEALLSQEVRQRERFYAGEFIPARTSTPFFRALGIGGET